MVTMSFQNTTPSRLPSAPRNVVVSRPANMVRAILCSVSILLIVMALYIAAIPIQRDIKLQHGTQTTGVVVDKYVRGSKSTSYHVSIRFSVQGRPMIEDARVSREKYAALAEDDSTMVTYLPSDPAVCKIGAVTPATTSEDLRAALPLVLPNFLIAILGPLLMETVIRGQTRLLRTGREAAATIGEVKKGEKQTLVLTYSFEAEGGRWTGTSTVSNRRQVTPGQTITVVYPLGKPQKSKAVLSLSLAALRNGTLPE